VKEVLGTVHISDVLAVVPERKENVCDTFSLRNRQRKIRHVFCGVSVKVASLRLSTFKQKGVSCVSCGLKGKYFKVERNNKNENYHLNLYGIDKEGNEVAMTKDHIVPKSKGGKDMLSNTQTMCAICNTKKGDTLWV
jgi:5-methylcytosine-specific restriction endonuclease McrA